MNPKDIEVSLIQADHEKSLGNWSIQQHSGIVLYHKPTGVQVCCTKHKSQYRNKSEAMLLLAEKVESSESCGKHIENLLRKLKTSLSTYEGLSLEEYDYLYGEVEEIQYEVFKMYNSL